MDKCRDDPRGHGLGVIGEVIAIPCRQVEQVSQAAAGDKVCAACEQDVDVDVEIVQDGSYVCPVGDGGVYCAPDEPCSLLHLVFDR